MSWTVSDEEFSAYPCEILRARPLGALAASLMGVSAIAVLAGALLFVRPAVEAPQSAAAPAAARSASATGSSASMNAEIFATAPSPVPVAKRSAAFDIDAAELAKEKKAYSLQQREGGGRQDTVSFGEFDGGKFYLRLDILQTPGEKLGNSDFYLDMARHAAQAGLTVARIGQPSPLASRFGAFESADIRLSQTSDDAAPAVAGERACLAVRLLNAKFAVEITGLACGAGAKPIDRRTVSCLLDRLQYAPGGEDKGLERLFSKTEDRGQSCFAAPNAADDFPTGKIPAKKPAKKPVEKRAPAAGH